MTKRQFDRKIAELIRTETKALRAEVNRLCDCGGIDLGSYGDDFRAPKIILTAALERMAENWRPLDHSDKREVDNLRHF